MVNVINEYVDENGKSPYSEWLAGLRDVKAKAYWQEYRRRN